MRELLTDDEVVFLASATNSGWPLPLLTIRLDVQEAVTAAAFRGYRSLLVRGLAGRENDENTISKELAEAIEEIGRSTRMTMAHVSDLDSIGLEGSATVLFECGTRLLLDSITVTGVHALGDSGLAEAKQSMLSFARSRYELKASAEQLRTCVLLSSTGTDTCVRVMPGTIEIGRVEQHNQQNVFVAHEGQAQDFAVVEHYLDAVLSSADGVGNTQ